MLLGLVALLGVGVGQDASCCSEWLLRGLQPGKYVINYEMKARFASAEETALATAYVYGDDAGEGRVPAVLQRALAEARAGTRGGINSLEIDDAGHWAWRSLYHDQRGRRIEELSVRDSRGRWSGLHPLDRPLTLQLRGLENFREAEPSRGVAGVLARARVLLSDYGGVGSEEALQCCQGGLEVELPQNVDLRCLSDIGCFPTGANELGLVLELACRAAKESWQLEITYRDAKGKAYGGLLVSFSEAGRVELVREHYLVPGQAELLFEHEYQIASWEAPKSNLSNFVPPAGSTVVDDRTSDSRVYPAERFGRLSTAAKERR